MFCFFLNNKRLGVLKEMRLLVCRLNDKIERFKRVAKWHFLFVSKTSLQVSSCQIHVNTKEFSNSMKRDETPSTYPP